MQSENRHRGGPGFSYVDVMIALTILLVGILTLGAALTAAFVRTTSGESYLRAKALASSTLESVMGARYVAVNDVPYTFDTIQNVGHDPGVFETGRHEIHEEPGPDGLLGTDDDSGDVIQGFEREIRIVDVNNPERPTPPNAITERRITVIVYYDDRGFERQESLTTNVCNY
jgi:hypothetical protein